MTTWLGRIGLVWLLVSLLTMVVLTVFVFVGARRTRLQDNRPRSITFDAPERVIDLTSRAQAAEDADEQPEPVITRTVTADSGALDRLLAGVVMPCGLERLAAPADDGVSRMAFCTSGHDAREVAVSVVDELERLGMDVEPLSYTEARAFRDGFEIAVTIFVEPARVIRDRRVAFPGVPADAVVIEFSVV